MILHPGILALLTGSLLALLMVLYAAGLGIKILLRWDFQSSSAGQLRLERQTHLISTIVNYALVFELLSGLLYIYTLDDLHPLFVGAMCATGSLNANPVGWYVLLVKIVVFFFAAGWVVLNRLDQRSEDCPLVRFKYRLLLLLVPLLLLGTTLQFSYFLGLQPEIITSCCAALFSLGGDGVAGEMASFPAGKGMALFYVLSVTYLLTLLLCLLFRKKVLRYLGLIFAIVYFLVAIVSIISFISLYIYELPTHHCPFDMVQKNYRYIGYPLYAGLFSGTFFGMLPGLFQPLKKTATLKREIERSEPVWLWLALISLLVFIGISTWPIVFGEFSLFGY